MCPIQKTIMLKDVVTYNRKMYQQHNNVPLPEGRRQKFPFLSGINTSEFNFSSSYSLMIEVRYLN